MAVVEATEEVRPGDSPSGSKSDKAAFLPARSFSGWRHGYYFRLGDAGLGYYLDVGAEAAEAIARSRRDGARSHSPPSTSRHLETPATDHPPMKRDLFEWFHKRVLARFSGRYLVDAGHLRVRVVSVWPHGCCGVVDAPDADVDAVAVACDVGVSVEWRAEFTFPGSDGALGSVSGRVKVASARLLEDGRVETGEVEVLVGGEKSRVERERDDARSAAAAELENSEAAAELENSDPDAVAHGVAATTLDASAADAETDVVPLARAEGESLEDRARAVMRDAGARRVVEAVVRSVADAVTEASGGRAEEIDRGAPWGDEVAAATEAAAATASKSATEAAAIRSGAFDIALERLRGCAGSIGGEKTITLAGVHLREVDVAEELAPALAACVSADAPVAVDLSRTSLTDAGVQRLVATLATGAAPALRELRLEGNDGLTAVADAMLRGLGMMRKRLKVSR